MEMWKKLLWMKRTFRLRNQWHMKGFLAIESMSILSDFNSKHTVGLTSPREALISEKYLSRSST